MTEREMLMRVLKRLNFEVIYESEKGIEFIPDSFDGISVDFDADGYITNIYV